MLAKSYKYKISIILTTYQSFSSLAHSLSNVLLQNFFQRDYEVIAISHGVPDGNKGYLFNLIPNNKTIFVPINPEMPYQPCYVRNQGINVAEGKLVLFLHDNVDLIGRNWLHQLWRDSKFGKRAVTTRKIVYRYSSDGTVERDYDIQNFYAQQDAVPLTFLRKVGGFDEIYDGDYGCDDIDLMRRCMLEGCEFYDSDLVSVKHNLRNMFPEQKPVANGLRNRRILDERELVWNTEAETISHQN